MAQNPVMANREKLASYVLPIGEIAEKDKDIKELAWSLNNPTPQRLYEACVFRCMVFAFQANLFHCTRIALGDYHPLPEKDWYRPFVAARCAWEECQFPRVGRTFQGCTCLITGCSQRTASGPRAADPARWVSKGSRDVRALSVRN